MPNLIEIKALFLVIVTWVLRLALAIVMLLAAIAKISDLAAFQKALQEAQMFSDLAARMLCYLIPSLELYFSVALLISKFVIEVPRAVLALFGLFFIYNLIGEKINSGGSGQACGCFGAVIEAELPISPLIRSGVLFAASGVLVILYLWTARSLAKKNRLVA